MTTRNVSQIPIPGMMMNTPAKSAAKSEESTTDFMQIMGGSLLNTANPNQMDEGISSPQKSDDLKVSKMDAKDTYQYERSSKEIPTTDEKDYTTASPEEKEAVSGAFETFKEKTVAVISEAMEGESEEDIENAMEELGLVWVDLMIPENVPMLLAELSGVEDEADLLISDTVSGVLDQMDQLVEELLTTTGFEDDYEVKAFLYDNGLVPDVETEETPVMLGPNGEVMGAEDLSNKETPLPVFTSVQNISETEENQMVTKQVFTGSETPVPAEVSLTGSAETEKIIQDRPKEEFFTDIRDENDLISPIAATTDTEDTAANTGEFGENPNTGFGQQRRPFGSDEVNAVASTENLHPTAPVVQANTSVSFSEALNEVTQPYTDINPRAIMEQIVTQTRTVVAENFSSMELELHPASLGKMYLQVSENDGHVTARLFTENESVKNAMESQMVALKESWEQQGMKISAVEITVGTKEYEEQLFQQTADSFQNETGSSGASAGGEEEGSRGNRMRNIDLNHLDEMPSDLTEEEALTASMMRDYGNSVNYMA